MSQQPHAIGAICRLTTRKHPGYCCRILDNRHAPLYTVRVAAGATDPAPDEYDTKAPKIIASHSTLTRI